MATILTEYKLFIATPSGLDEEREQFNKAILEYNISDANHQEVQFTPVGWELTIAGIGRPQELINQEVKKCDYFILILHDRWGSPTSSPSSHFTSGTQEELYIALECYKSKSLPMKDIVMFFKSVNPRQLSDPGGQLQKVLAFRREIEEKKEFLFHTYDTVDSFSKLLRRLLAQWLRKHESEPEKMEPRRTTLKEDLLTLEGHSSDAIYSAGILGDTKSLLDSAELLFAEGKVLEAEILFSQIAVRGESAIALARYGRFLRKIGQPDRAIDFLKKAVALSATSMDAKTNGYATRQLARVFEAKGKHKEAIDMYNDAIKIYENDNNIGGLGRTHRDIALILRKRGNYIEAISHLKKSMDLYNKISDLGGIAAGLGYLGLVFKSIGDLDEAEEAHKKSLEIQIKRRDSAAVAIVKGNLGVVYRMKGKLEDAKRMHRGALASYKKVNNLQGMAREYSNLGMVSYHSHNYRHAIKMFELSQSFSERLGNLHGIAMQHSNLGRVYTEQGLFEMAEGMHKKSLLISEQLGDKPGFAIQYGCLGQLYYKQRSYKKAEEAFRRSLEIYEALGGKIGIADSNLSIAKSLIGIGKHDEALLFLQKAEEKYIDIDIQSHRTEIDDMKRVIRDKTEKH